MLTLSHNLGIQDFYKVLFENMGIQVAPSVLDRVEQSFNFLKTFSENKTIYGVNTGFGPMAQYKIDDNAKLELQYNLIRSHSSGVGNPLPPLYVKASMLARMNTLALGHSGVHKSVIELMSTMINRDILPVIYEHGGVGASGDLVQLAHLALTLIGEGEVYYQGEIRRTQEVFELEKLEPITVALREGLALMNGTSVMTGIGIVNTIYSKRLLNWMISCSASINELVGAYDDHLSQELNGTKRHKGQQKVASLMCNHLNDSQLIKKRDQHLYKDVPKDLSVFEDKVQEYYSLRCVPQILGPVYDTLMHAEKIMIEEVNSANDNPIVHMGEKQVYHGGNFHGDYVALEMDKLKLAITKLSMLSERQLNYLLNHNLNNILPPFVNLGKLGLNFGMQGVQFTATSTTAENQMLSNPMYIHSIPNNNDNQDIVSMGTNAALITKKVIENAFEVVAIETITIVQAIDYLKIQDQVSSETKKLYYQIRQIVPIFTEDMVMYPYVKKVKEYIMNI